MYYINCHLVAKVMQYNTSMLILGIESSCDETAVALVKDGIYEIASSLATSSEIHEKTGGVVPEIAARKQVEFIVPVLEDLFEKGIKELNLKNKQELIDIIDAIAVTYGPGLIGSLLVGIEAAKTLSFTWNKPLVPVNHLVGHIYGNFLKTDIHDPKDIKFPALVLVVSGGHTDLVLMKDHGKLEYLGGTLDDAAGEAFDKVARILGISDYLGGAKLSKLANTCAKNTLENTFPRPKINDNDYDFSFSGLKTFMKRFIEQNVDAYEKSVIAKEFENAVIDVLVKKTLDAANKFNVTSILLGGGVSANVSLRNVLTNKAKNMGIPVYIPPISLCTDNAVYISSAAFFNFNPVDISEIEVNPSLEITS